MHGWIPQMHLNVTSEERNTLCKGIILNNATQAKTSIATQLRANGQISEGKH